MAEMNFPPDMQYTPVRIDKRLRTGLNPKAATSPSESKAWGTTTIPKGQQWVGRKAKAMHYQIVEALLAKNGVISLSQKYILHSIVRAEIHCQLAERLRRDKWEDGTLSLEQFDTISKGIVKITAMRDAMVLRLGIDENQLDVFAQAMDDDRPDYDDPSEMLETTGEVVQ